MNDILKYYNLYIDNISFNQLDVDVYGHPMLWNFSILRDTIYDITNNEFPTNLWVSSGKNLKLDEVYVKYHE